MSAVDIDFPGNLSQVDTAAELRDIPSTLIADGALYLVSDLSGLFAYNTGSTDADNGTTVIKPNDKTSLQAGRWVFEIDGLAVGPAGPALATYVSLATFKAASIANKTQILASPASNPGIFTWETANAPYTADDVNVIKADSTALSVGAWVRQAATGVNFDGRTVDAKLRETLTVTDKRFAGGADPTGAVDSRAAFNAAAVAASNGGLIIVPRGRYLISDVVDVLDGQTWRFEGSTLYHSDDSRTILRVTGKSDFAIEGHLILEGLLVAAATAAETGLRITGSRRGRVDGVEARKFKGKGIWLDGANPGPYRGDRIQFTNCSANENTVGRQVDAGAEYTVWTNFNASGNVTGDIIAGGNVITVGGNIVDNVTTGISLLSGSNHGHGMYVGVNINHNGSENLNANGVLNGYTFVGCHFYGNGGSTGAIVLTGCRGIRIADGTVDCQIFNVLGGSSGPNFITDCYFPGDYGVTLNGNGLAQLYLSGNSTPTGMSGLNDASPVFVEATRATTGQSVSSAGTTLVFNNEVKDQRAAYDPTTGIFTAPVDGTYELETSLLFTADSTLTASEISVSLNNTTSLGSIPMIAVSGTRGIASGVIKKTLAAGNTLRLKSTINGTNPLLAISESSLTISLCA